MNKRKIMLIAMSLSIVAILAMGATLAYFTAEDEVENVITMGNVDIVLDEAEVVKNDDNTWTAGEARVQTNTYENVFPGAVLPKDPTIHNTGSLDAYVRVQVTVVNGFTVLTMYAETDEKYTEGFMEMIGGELGEGWTITDGISSMDYLESIMGGVTDATVEITYSPKLAAGASTTPVFENIIIPTDIDQDNNVPFVQENGIEINIVAEAIQADTFADVTAAFAAFDAE